MNYVCGPCVFFGKVYVMQKWPDMVTIAQKYSFQNFLKNFCDWFELKMSLVERSIIIYLALLTPFLEILFFLSYAWKRFQPIGFRALEILNKKTLNLLDGFLKARRNQGKEIMAKICANINNNFNFKSNKLDSTFFSDYAHCKYCWCMNW